MDKSKARLQAEHEEAMEAKRVEVQRRAHEMLQMKLEDFASSTQQNTVLKEELKRAKEEVELVKEQVATEQAKRLFQVGVLLVGLLCPSLVDVTSCVARCAVPVSCSGGVSLLACAVGAGRRCLGCGFVGVPLANVPVSLYEDGKGVAGREVWTALDRVQQPPRVNHRSNGGHRYVRLRCSCARDVQQAAGGCAPCRLQALRAHPSSDGSNGIAAQEVRWLGRCGGP